MRAADRSAGEFEFAHYRLEEETAAIGGRYGFIREARLPCGGREVLYYVGYAVLDNACCGAGGTAFARVAGFVLEWHCGRSPDGRPISRLARVAAGDLQAALSRRIRAGEHVPQVDFI
jgi:hypothetical protein